MRDLLPQLVDLNDVDKSAAQLREQLQLYPRMLTDLDRKEEAARARRDRAKDQLAHAREARRKAELEAVSLREKILKYQAQQALVKTNKEYAAITEEINAVKAKIDEVETGGLEALEQEDSAGSELKQAEAALERESKEFQAERRRIQDQVQEKESRLNQLVEEHRRRVEQLPEDFQELFNPPIFPRGKNHSGQ
jgi:predicted  nucleic acid-binding Zn-ribbon protein